MPTLSFIFTVVQHTPIWVWGLLVLLVVLGLSQARTRRIGLARATLLPLAMLGLSLWGVLSAFGSTSAVAAWLLAMALVTALSLRVAFVAGASWLAAERRFQMPGSWWPLVLILGIFITKYGVAVTLALHPQLHAVAGFAIGACLLYGVFSGLFVGRALTLWRLRRPAAPTARRGPHGAVPG